METSIKAFMAVIFSIGAYVVLSIIPIINLLAAPMAVLAGLGLGTYLMSKSD